MTRTQFLTISTISFLLVTTTIFQSNCEAQVPVHRSIFLNDLGVSRLDRQGNPYITINPIRCRQLGPELCEFFQQHEYGHINLKHLERRVRTRQAEAEADCYAAKHVSPSVANAALEWFNSGNGSSLRHGSSQQRAARVSSCSLKDKPIKVPARSLTRRVVVPSNKSFASNAVTKSPRRTVSVRSSSVKSSRPSKLVYVNAPKSVSTTTLPTIQGSKLSSVRTTTAPVKRISSTTTVTRPRISAQSCPTCR